MSRRRVQISRTARVSLALVVACLAVAVPHGRQQAQAPAAVSPADPYPNFDVRDFKQDPRLTGNAGVAAYMDVFGTAPATAGDALADGRSAMDALRSAAPGVRVEAGRLGGAEIVSAMPGTRMLADASGDRVTTLRAFLRGRAPAYGLSVDQADDLVVVADEMNPAGNLAWVELEQRLNGIPVFQGTLRAAFTAKGDLARTVGLLATGVTPASLVAAPALSAAEAVGIAAANVGLSAPAASLVEREQRDGTVVFAQGALGGEPRAWLVYFPLAHGVARLAWVTEVFGDPLAFMSVVDAETGTVLWRKNLTDFQTQSATYNVYPSDSPAPASPSPALPGAGYVAPAATRVTDTRVGNEGVFSFNANGWITDGANVTDGNNVEAGLDLVTPNGVDAPVTGTPNRVFTASYNPASEAPSTAQYRRGEVINMFYWANRFHDETYRLGFTEGAHNFQHTNFTGQGAGNDRISAETQDSSGTNNANFATPADGSRPRMQMYVWTGPSPDNGGGLDADVMIHEMTHGLSNRLHNNATGLSTNMSRGLGEGWSDFYARALLSDASENVNGIYTLGGWATDELAPGVENYYYGIRRFPYAVKTSVGANGKPHNPLTFADIDQTQANLTDGAFAQNPALATGTQRDQVHEQGQVWAMMLLEIRARFITRLGHAVGNQRILQYVTDGMKLDPAGPTFLTARDSILAAANASGASQADIDDIWAGFATRGLGVLAAITVNGSGANDTRVAESFLRPNDPVPTFAISDVSATEGNAGGKTFAFTVSLTNPNLGPSTVGFATANGTATSAAGAPVGTSPGGLIALPVSGTNGPASQYPGTLNLAGLTGTITKLAVRLDGLTHTWPADLDMLLVGPGGQKALFMSDLGDGGDVSNLTVTFEDGAATPPATQLVAGTYAPTDLTPGDVLNAPAPTGPYTSTLSVFNGTSPNGTWNLYVMDDTAADVGSLASFTLIMATTTTAGDYAGTSGTLSFPPGTTSLPVHVTVQGDTTLESNESFVVNLSAPTNAVIGDGQGVGTIVNDDGTPPTATADAFNTPFGTPLTIAAPGVLANDAANGGGALTAVQVTPPSNGTLSFLAGGGFTYTPASGFAGVDTFTYRAVSATSLQSAPATVAISVAHPTTPQPPTGLYVAALAGNRVTLRWTGPLVGPAVTGFLLEGGVTPGGYIGEIPLGPLPILTIDLPSAVLYLRVRTITAAGTSAVSNEVAAHVNVATPPSAPANLLASVQGQTLALMWRNTFSGGAAAGTMLDVTGPLAGSLALGPGETLQLPGVPAGTYTLRVRSANGAGASGQSNAVTVTLPGGCTGAPSTPTKFLAYRVGSTLFVIWESPVSGPAPTGFVLDATGTVVTASVPMGAATSLSVPVPPGTYHLTVSAVNACGSSTPTAVQTVIVP